MMLLMTNHPLPSSFFFIPPPTSISPQSSSILFSSFLPDLSQPNYTSIPLPSCFRAPYLPSPLHIPFFYLHPSSIIPPSIPFLLFPSYLHHTFLPAPLLSVPPSHLHPISIQSPSHVHPVSIPSPSCLYPISIQFPSHLHHTRGINSRATPLKFVCPHILHYACY